MNKEQLAKFKVDLEKLREEIAHRIFTIKHGKPSDYAFTPWGHTGTVDDESWRSEERKCFDDADSLIKSTLIAKLCFPAEKLTSEVPAKWHGSINMFELRDK